MKLLLPLALLATLALSESAKQRLRSPRRGNRNVHRREKSAKGTGGGGSGSGDTGGIGNRVDEAFGGDGACDESAETQPFSIVASAKNQEPELVEYDNQCYSACDCESRCCSNYPYYIQFDSYFSGVSNRAGPKGGVCVERKSNNPYFVYNSTLESASNAPKQKIPSISYRILITHGSV